MSDELDFGDEICARCRIRPFVVRFTALGVSDIAVDALVGLCAECLDELGDMRRAAAPVTRDQALLQVAQIANNFPGTIASFTSIVPAPAVMGVELSDGSHLTVIQQGDLQALWRAADDLRLKRQRETR